MSGVPCGLFFSVKQGVDKDEEQGDVKEVDKGCGEHAATNGRPDPLHRPGAGPRCQGKGQNAEKEGERGHHNRPQPDPCCSESCFDKPFSVV